jgi:hypothetical protein
MLCFWQDAARRDALSAALLLAGFVRADVASSGSVSAHKPAWQARSFVDDAPSAQYARQTAP